MPLKQLSLAPRISRESAWYSLTDKEYACSVQNRMLGPLSRSTFSKVDSKHSPERSRTVAKHNEMIVGSNNCDTNA